MAKIFINYRREDSNWSSQMIYNDLMDSFDNSVFKDQNIPSGENFENRIIEEIEKCRVFLVVINKEWLNIFKKRPKAERDFVVEEIQKALELNKEIIPVLIDNTVMPSVSELPDSIKELAMQNASLIDLQSFDSQMENLKDSIERYLRQGQPRKRVLVLDDCAARGAITLGILKKLEDLLSNEANQTKSLSESFDVISSSGVTSMIVALLGMGMFIDEIIPLYDLYVRSLYKNKREITLSLISKKASYHEKNALAMLKDVFGDIAITNEKITTCIAIFCYNLDSGITYPFTNINSKDFVDNSNVLLRDAVYASSAYPTYHEPIAIKTITGESRYISGNLAISNDSSLALTLFLKTLGGAYTWNMNSDQLSVLSIGNGIKKHQEPRNKLGVLKWAQMIPDILLDNFGRSNNELLSMISNSPLEEQDVRSSHYFERAEGDPMFNLYRIDPKELQIQGINGRIRNTDFEHVLPAYQATCSDSSMDEHLKVLVHELFD